MDMLLTLYVNLILSTLRATIKNPARKEQLKRRMLDVYTNIKIVYADDPDFN